LALWTPDEVIGYKHGWDASDTGSITESGDDVSQIDDQYGTEHLVSSGGDEPETNTRTLNSLNALDFDGTELMDKTSFPIPVSGDFAVFLMVSIDGAAHIQDAVLSMQEASNNSWQFDSDDASDFNGAIDVSNVGVDSPLTGGPYHTPTVFSIVFDLNDTGFYNAWVDGNKRTTDEDYNSAIGSSVDLLLFANRVGLQQMDGAFGELVIIDDVTEETRQLMEGYLCWKWGTEGNLPGGHPYESAAPTIPSDKFNVALLKSKNKHYLRR